MSSRHVAEYPYSRKIDALQRLYNLLRLRGGIARHRLIEALGVVAIGLSMVECHVAEFPHKCVLLAIPDHRRKMSPQRVMLRSFLQPGHGRQRAWMCHAQQIAALCQCEPTRRV